MYAASHPRATRRLREHELSKKKTTAQHIPIELPLPKFLGWAIEKNEALYEHPKHGGMYRSPMWEFVRLCRAHPELARLSADDAFRKLGRIPWEECFPDSDDPEIEFLTTWDKVRVPAGQDILVLAVGLARDVPLTLSNPISDKYSRLVSIAAHLQSLRPGDHIKLPVGRLGEILGVNDRTISFYIQRATKDGYLTRIARHHHPSGTAAKYTFACERFDMETGEGGKTREESHFHKDSEDSEEFKESDDPREKFRATEETGRLEGPSGSGIDSERQRGNLRGWEARKIPFQERQKEAQEQLRVFAAKKNLQTT